MARRVTSFEVSIDQLTTAMGVRTHAYPAPDMQLLAGTVVQRLQAMIASRAIDAENGNVVDEIVAAWIVEEKEKLKVRRVRAQQSSEELVAQASAFVDQAAGRVAEARSRLTDAQSGHREHVETSETARANTFRREQRSPRQPRRRRERGPGRRELRALERRIALAQLLAQEQGLAQERAASHASGYAWVPDAGAAPADRTDREQEGVL